MLSHATLGIRDFERAYPFYEAVLAGLGWRQFFAMPERSWAAWRPPEAERPLVLIGKPFDGEPAAPGNGQMIAFEAPTRAAVDVFHATALAKGGTCEGPPGLRPHYHPDYYGAYVRDPDGNKLCVVCHRPE